MENYGQPTPRLPRDYPAPTETLPELRRHSLDSAAMPSIGELMDRLSLSSDKPRWPEGSTLQPSSSGTGHGPIQRRVSMVQLSFQGSIWDDTPGENAGTELPRARPHSSIHTWDSLPPPKPGPDGGVSTFLPPMSQRERHPFDQHSSSVSVESLTGLGGGVGVAPWQPSSWASESLLPSHRNRGPSATDWRPLPSQRDASLPSPAHLPSPWQLPVHLAAGYDHHRPSPPLYPSGLQSVSVGDLSTPVHPRFGLSFPEHSLPNSGIYSSAAGFSERKNFQDQPSSRRSSGQFGWDGYHHQEVSTQHDTPFYQHPQQSTPWSSLQNDLVQQRLQVMLDTLATLPSLALPQSATTHPIGAAPWAVIRATHFAWDASLEEIQSFFYGIPSPPEHLLPQNIHILMDRETGKTLDVTYVELALTGEQALVVVQTMNKTFFKGRTITLEMSSQDELMRAVFPKWEGQFINGEPLVPGEELIPFVHEKQSLPANQQNEVQSVPEASEEDTPFIWRSSSTPPFVTREEMYTLLVVCRNFRQHYPRKCAGRPFESILTIISKYPWHQPYRVLPLHRDQLFELLKLAMASLRRHLGRDHHRLNSTLLDRMVRCAVLTPGFTERQKSVLLCTAEQPCPEELVGWMTSSIQRVPSVDTTAVTTTTTATGVSADEHKDKV